MLVDPILMVIMLNKKQNQTDNKERSKKKTDPIRQHPYNRAPKLGCPTPHF
jgi:hypothetical protein